MRIDRAGADGPVIRGFTADGAFRVDERSFAAVLLTPLAATAWQPPSLDALGTTDLAPLLDLTPAPEFLLLGTGATLSRPPRTLVSALDERGIGVEAMDSRAAARAWAVLRSEGRWIGAALYPL